MNRRTFWVSTLAVALALPFVAFAQNQGGGGGGGRFNPEEFRKRMMDDLREDLGATGDEWQVLEPKVEKVMAATRDARFGGMFGGRGGRGRGGPGGGGRGGFNMPETPVSKAAEELNTLLENKDAPADQITAKLTALREARAKARADLAAAQKELQEVLTPRQEAVLVARGMLD